MEAKRAGGVVQMVEYLCEALNLNPSTNKKQNKTKLTKYQKIRQKTL
jgi:hypothetical protein